MYSTRDKKQDKEIQRRTTAGWTAFAKHRDIFKGHIGICVKREVYNPSMLNITYGDRKINIWLNEKTVVLPNTVTYWLQSQTLSPIHLVSFTNYGIA